MAHLAYTKIITCHKQIILAVYKYIDRMFTLEWQASIKTIKLQVEDLQVAQINQLYITSEDICICQIETNSTEERFSTTKHISHWNGQKYWLKWTLIIESILLGSFAYVKNHFVFFNMKKK